MTGRDVAFILGAIGLMVLALGLVQLWTKWRKRSIVAAGKSIGLLPLPAGQSLQVVLVPLINRPNRTYFIILCGVVKGYQTAFFDLYCSSGKNWDYQSTLLFKN